MRLFATFRKQRRAAPLLGVVVVAFLSLAATPCAMASSVEMPTTKSAHAAHSHDHCSHASSAKAKSEADCCCDLEVVLNGAKLEVPKPIVQHTLAADLYLLTPLIVDHRQDRAHTISTLATLLPVYLSTQRLRL